MRFLPVLKTMLAGGGNSQTRSYRVLEASARRDRSGRLRLAPNVGIV
jgi:hypothetical protein